MKEVVLRKDHTSIACTQLMKRHQKKTKYFLELTLDILLIVTGVFLLLFH